MFPLVALLFFFLTYLVLKTIYRLTLHPLAGFPGPKLAAVTSLYNAYYDILQPGLIKKLPEMHKKYGDVIRVQPGQLHVASLEGFNQYASRPLPISHSNPYEGRRHIKLHHT